MRRSKYLRVLARFIDCRLRAEIIAQKHSATVFVSQTNIIRVIENSKKFSLYLFLADNPGRGADKVAISELRLWR